MGGGADLVTVALDLHIVGAKTRYSKDLLASWRRGGLNGVRGMGGMVGGGRCGTWAAREFTLMAPHKRSMTVNFFWAISGARKELIWRPASFIST